jgi:hypothetical protein
MITGHLLQVLQVVALHLNPLYQFQTFNI